MAWRGLGCVLLLLGLGLGLGLGGCGDEAQGPPTYTIACAASLRRVVPDLLALHAAGAPAARFQATYGASGMLRRQVEAGAPVCGVVFASDQDVERLIQARRIDPASRTVLARNTLVLLGAPGTPPTTFRTLRDLPADARIAIGDPRTAPAGRYAKSALERLGLWDALEERLLPVSNVAAVTAYVRRGEVSAGVVYATEATLFPDLRVLDRADGDWAPRPVVVGGVCLGADGEDAFRDLLRFLGSDPARAVWTRHGFLPP